MSKPVAVTDGTFQSVVLESDKLVLVDFWATWCPPCKQIAPILDELATELENDLVIGKIDTDENPSTPASYGVFGLPTLLLFKNGELVERIIGFKPKSAILGHLQRHMN